MEWFDKQSKIVRVILLVIPFVGWICEIIVRWSEFLKKSDATNLVIALIYTFFGAFWVLHLIDAILVLLDKPMLFRTK